MLLSAVRKRSLLRWASVFLTFASVFVISLLMGAHTPFRTLTARADASQRRAGHWQVVYVLGSNFPCSRRLARHLMTGHQLRDIEERVIAVGDEAGTENRLAAAGWRVEKFTAESAREQFGAQSAPLAQDPLRRRVVATDGRGRRISRSEDLGRAASGAGCPGSAGLWLCPAVRLRKRWAGSSREPEFRLRT
jgi:hypothetical protein